jgi:uncharacterized protein
MTKNDTGNCASSRGVYFNTGSGIQLQSLDIGHGVYTALVSAETAFWALVRKDRLADALADTSFLREYRRKEKSLKEEMDRLRFGRNPLAVYFNATDRCNLDCSYCYIPKRLRRNGGDMSAPKIFRALKILKVYFRKTLPGGIKPQIVFHGAEPLLNKEAVLDAMDGFAADFRFGIQTNGSLLDNETLDFLTSRNVSIGLSLDGHNERIANRLRRTRGGDDVYGKVVGSLKRLRGYGNYSVICTVTKENAAHLTPMVDFLHSLEVPACMLNAVRCALSGARSHKPSDHYLALHYMKALDRSYRLYKNSGRRIVIANFANVLAGILAPSARRLMCDISPCGGGRYFFAVAAGGDVFPCSEFIGLKKFKGGNIFRDDLRDIMRTDPFNLVTGRRVEDIEPCRSCAIRHFCGSPCPAEAHEMNGGMNRPGAFCELYEEQVRYALRAIADRKENAYLWNDWPKNLSASLEITRL